jgi:(p)ppGpp synthase/HD superfamily hydrolase
MEQINLFERAVCFAVEKHHGMFRKGKNALNISKPYIMHPLSVASLIFEHVTHQYNVYLLATAAVLHDVVEDCYEDKEAGFKDIVKAFGINVASLVIELTLDKNQYKEIGKANYLVQHMNKMSHDALIIKLCDRWDNVRDLSFTKPAFNAKYISETNFILDNLTRPIEGIHKFLVAQIRKTINE